MRQRQGIPFGSDEGAAESAGPSGSGVATKVAVLTRFGGIAGQHDVLTVQEDGALILERDGKVESGHADAAAITALQDHVNSAEWQALDTKYGVQSPDAFSYVLDAGGKSVTTYDSAQNPEPLAGVLDQLLQLLQSLNCTGGSGTN